ncbi:polyprenyl synthetase family protein [Candidatus Chloroploca asiatica]|uniref:Polyprenyl synthetase n=1 Tax=Candidatus Chloroploca asiatica TaxID=1506545 RepID=A0A2H3L3K8_9CHLR|nr:polyprenyl synthetase family protein [Candidatus Chloroploca asiatica]PDV96820.1 hypothetical protein A9Q02_20290 [Candidatus Chloroploca asiatica]
MQSRAVDGDAPFLAHVRQFLADPTAATPRRIWLETMAKMTSGFGAAPGSSDPFIQAWQWGYTATLLLDHLQDGDVITPQWVADQPLALQYHLAFSSYVLAQRQLAALDPAVIPLRRCQRIQVLWADLLFRCAAGQYRDLTTVAEETHGVLGEEPLAAYEQICAYKTGTLFALAFGGIAALATDAQPLIEAATNAGMVYGMLLQYYDDLTDTNAQEQQLTTLTLQRALRSMKIHAEEREHLVAITWSLVHAQYLRALHAILAPLPDEVQTVMHTMIEQTVGGQRDDLLEVMVGAARNPHAR